MTPEERQLVIDAMERQSESQLVTFFAAFDLAEAFESPGRGWGKGKKLGAALIAARQAGSIDAVMSAAMGRFLAQPSGRNSGRRSVSVLGRSIPPPPPTKKPSHADQEPEAGPPVVFVTHVADEYAMAKVLKDALEQAFPGKVDVFVSSDSGSIPLGEKWLESITRNLRISVAQIIVASPASVIRPWVNFEAGAGWVRSIPVMPLFHSGLTAKSLPLPLNMLQAAPITTSDGLRKVFAAVAKVIGSQAATTDYASVAAQMREIEGAMTKAGISTLPALQPPTRSSLQLRDLSADRIRMESTLFAKILELQTLRSKGRTPSDAGALSRALEDAVAFWSGPDKMSDEQVQDAATVLEGVLSDMKENRPPDLRRMILRRLRSMERRQATQAEILTLDLDAVANDAGVTRASVQGALAELIRSGRVEGYLETLGQSATDGACRITAKGLEEVWDEPAE